VDTVVSAPPEPASRPELSDENLETEVRARLERGESPSQIAKALAAHGRRRIYQLALAARDRAGRG
jgi:hypothetical protein